MTEPETARPPGAGPGDGQRTSIVRVVVSSMVGTMLENYDFFLYGLAAALVFPAVFFPAENALAGTLLSFGTFAIGFVARPLGGFVFGHFGDRVGRKALLVLSLVVMGVATFLIGLLPGSRRSGSPPRSCWWCCGWSRASRWAASGAVPSCWCPNTPVSRTAGS